jgi:hypothetical protein
MDTFHACRFYEKKSPGSANPSEKKTPELTPDEQKRVRAALVFMYRRLGSWEALARAMGMKEHTVVYSARSANHPPTAATAIRVARTARVPIDDVLDGKWPPKGACPLCGHVTEAP